MALHHDRHLPACSHRYFMAGDRAHGWYACGWQQRQPVTCGVCNRSTPNMGSPAACQ